MNSDDRQHKQILGIRRGPHLGRTRPTGFPHQYQSHCTSGLEIFAVQLKILIGDLLLDRQHGEATQGWIPFSICPCLQRVQHERTDGSDIDIGRAWVGKKFLAKIQQDFA